MKYFASLLFVFLVAFSACTDDDTRPSVIDGDIVTDGDTAGDGDGVSDGDTDSSDGDTDAPPVDGDQELVDGDADTSEGDGEEDAATCSDVDPEDLPRIFPADVTCWTHSSHAVTNSDGTLAEWRAACENADAGNANYRCRAATVMLVDSNGAHNAVQCESWHVCDEDPGWPTDVQSAWLGPAYGNIANDMNIFETRVTGLVTASAYMNCTGTYPSWPPDAAVPAWTTERIDDALAHDVSTAPCEQITNYRQCVRAFIPPNSHCVPLFDYPDNVAAISEACDWENDPLFYTAEFVGCTTVTEPFNWPL